MPFDSHIIRADKTPAGEQARRFTNCRRKFVICLFVIVGENLKSRDVVPTSRNNVLKRVFETYKTYDALQYPLIVVRGKTDTISILKWLISDR